MPLRDRAVDAGEPKFRLSVSNHVGHDLIPDATNGPTPNSKISVMPITRRRWDQPAFRAMVQTTDDRFDRTPILDPRTNTPDLPRRNGGLKVRPLGIRQNPHPQTFDFPSRHQSGRGQSNMQNANGL